MRKLLSIIILFGVMTISGCALNQMVKMAEDQNLTVTPNPLEVHADTVAFEMSASLPVKMLKKGKVYTINTFYKYGDSEIALEPIQFKAEDYPNADSQQPQQTKEFAFAYSPAMKNGMLQIQGVALDPKNGKSKETPRMDVAPGVITTSQLVQKVYAPTFADHGYNTGEELVPVTVNFYFLQGSPVLRYSEKRSDRGDKLDAYIAAKNVTKTVTITGTHSPEGPERINASLSINRAKAIEDYYRKQMSKYDYKGQADSIKFITKDIVEDWSVFKDSLAVYNGISSEEKSAYLDIINGPGSYVEKEDKLHKLPTYNKVFKELYPKLRVAKTSILKVKEKKSDAEISVLAKQIAEGTASADKLNEKELMYGATLTPSLKEKEAIYIAATKKTGSWEAHNNLGAVYIAMAAEGDNASADKAMAQLEIAANKNAAPEVHANLASVQLMKGNPYKAHEHLNKATGLSGEQAQDVAGVKSAVAIMIADYGTAVTAASNASDNATNLFNKGLAQILNKDYQNAITSFEEAVEKDADMALAYYGAAIAHARSNNADGVVTNLEIAVKKNPELKERALNDLVFAEYTANEAFRNALK